MWNDRRLARRAARGDRDAFAAIFRRYEQDLYRYCVAILGDPQDAQDALQNTMVKALRALPGERRQIELKPWLYRVAHNESIELRRGRRPSEPLAEEMPAPGASPEQRAADRRRLRDLLADLGELPARHRGALVMRELAGLDFEEIAAALDTSAGAARQVLYEARRGLQQMSDGREMECDAITALLSERDGRVARRRDVRTHLRDCPDCRRFADAIRGRSETLAGIAPLPAVAAAGIAKGASAGAASGGATAGATGGGSIGGAAGTVGGVAAKLASTGAIVKVTTAVVAFLAVGAVAAHRGHLSRGDTPAPGVDGGAAAARVAPGTAAPGASGARHAPVASAGSGAPGALTVARRVERIGFERPSARDATAAAEVVAGDAAPASVENAGADGPTGAGEARPSRPPHPAHPTHPEHPSHPSPPPHPPHPARPSHPEHPAHPGHPDQPQNPAHPDHPQQPGHPEEAARPARSTRPATSSRPEPRSQPQPSTAAPGQGSRAAAAPATDPAPANAAAAESPAVESPAALAGAEAPEPTYPGKEAAAETRP